MHRGHAFDGEEVAAKIRDQPLHLRALPPHDAFIRGVNDEQINPLPAVQGLTHFIRRAIHDTHAPIHRLTVLQLPSLARRFTGPGKLQGKKFAFDHAPIHFVARDPGPCGKQARGFAEAVADHLLRLHAAAPPPNP